MENRKYIFLPVEVKVRDFVPRLYFACWAAQYGANAILGQDRLIIENLSQFPKGVIFDKSISKHKAKKLLRACQQGFRILSEDAESLGFYRKDNQEALEERVCELTLDYTSRYYCWGDEQKRILQTRYPEYAERFVTTGSFRFDVLRGKAALWMEESKLRIHEKLGDYILINSNFGRIHHCQGADFIRQQQIDYGVYKTTSDLEHYQNLVEYEEAVCDNFLKVIERFRREFPTMKIVVRPHPSEDERYWRYLVKPFNGAFVISSLAAPQWMNASSLLFHHGCTTAVEAVAMGLPSITWNHEYTSSNTMISNYITASAESLDGVVESARRQLSGEHLNMPEVLRHLESRLPFKDFAYFDEAKEGSVRILEDMVENELFELSESEVADFREMKEYLYPTPSHQIGERFLTQLFPGIAEAEVRKYVNQWNASGLFAKPVNVKKLGENLFVLGA